MVFVIFDHRPHALVLTYEAHTAAMKETVCEPVTNIKKIFNKIIFQN